MAEEQEQEQEQAEVQSPRTTHIFYCESCNLEMPAGKFCGECGSGLVQREVESTKKSGGLSIFEQNALATQKSSGSATRDHKFTGSKPAAGYCGTFGDEQRKKAQEQSNPAGFNKFGGAKPSGGYVGTFGDDQRKKAQQAAANTGFNKFGGQKPVGGGMDLITAHNVSKQKMMSEASRTKDSIVLSTEKKSEGTIDIYTANQLKQQKETSSAHRQGNDIIMSTEKKSEGSMDIYTTNQLKQQKETSAVLRQGDKTVKSTGGAEISYHGGGGEQAEEPAYFCSSCNEARPQGKFCQDCGTPLTAQ